MLVRAIPREALPSLLPMEECVERIDRCMREVSSGNAELPLRWGLPVADRGALGMMPGYLGEPRCFGIKLVSLFPGNRAAGLSSHSGVIVLYENRVRTAGRHDGRRICHRLTYRGS